MSIERKIKRNAKRIAAKSAIIALSTTMAMGAMTVRAEDIQTDPENTNTTNQIDINQTAEELQKNYLVVN